MADTTIFSISSDIHNGITNNILFKTFANNTVLKLIVFSIFIFAFKDVIINIFIFFGIESTNVYLYVSWFVFLLLLVVILPSSNGLIK
jgi:hypothetical protein